MVTVSAIAFTIVSVTKLILGRRVSQNPAGSVADARLERLEHAVDAIALEIERISEGQRFTTKLLSEQSREKKAARELPSDSPS
jgi:hypothetical protein